MCRYAVTYNLCNSESFFLCFKCNHILLNTARTEEAIDYSILFSLVNYNKMELVTVIFIIKSSQTRSNDDLATTYKSMLRAHYKLIIITRSS